MQNHPERPGEIEGRRGPPFGCEYCGQGGFPTLAAVHGHRRSHVDLVREDRAFTTEEALLFLARRFGGINNVPESYRRNLDQQLGIRRDHGNNGGEASVSRFDLNLPPPPNRND